MIAAIHRKDGNRELTLLPPALSRRLAHSGGAAGLFADKTELQLFSRFEPAQSRQFDSLPFAYQLPDAPRQLVQMSRRFGLADAFLFGQPGGKFVRIHPTHRVARRRNVTPGRMFGVTDVTVCVETT